MFTKTDITKDKNGRYSGTCSRCGHKSHFRSQYEGTAQVNDDYGNVHPYSVTLLECPCGEFLLLESDVNYENYYVTPQTSEKEKPDWVPEYLEDDYTEFTQAKNLNMNNAVVALASIVVDKVLNSKLDSKFQKKTIGPKIEHLFKSGALDNDQLSSGTIMRLTRNDVLHPKTTSVPPTDEEIELLYEEVVYFLEREFKFRSSRALPAPAGSK